MLTKERIFEIMGKYYGNAHYRSAIRLAISEHDLALTTELLDKINALGYSFSNLHKLMETEDLKFVPLILSYYDKFESSVYQESVLASIRFKSYHEYIPQLLQIYHSATSLRMRVCASECIFHIGSPRYISACLEIVNHPSYGSEHDYLLAFLCKCRVHKVLPKLLELSKTNPKTWQWTFLQYISYFKDVTVLPYIEPFLENDDSEIRAKARAAIKKLTANI